MSTPLTINSVETLQEALPLIRASQEAYGTFTQEQVDAICEKTAMAVSKMRIPLAKMACEETGYGIVVDKVTKNQYASEHVWNYMRNKKTCGVISEDKAYGVKKIASPKGVIAAITPTTNPTSTTIYKIMLALKTRNAIILSPHPHAVNCSIAAAKIMRDAAIEAGLPEHVISWISVPSLEISDVLMKSVDLIMATGGSGMVKAAYSSGTPAIGVGPGNCNVVIDETADLRMAVESIIHSKTFDNGMICASEQHITVLASVYDEVKRLLKEARCYFLNDEEAAKVADVFFNAKTHGVKPDAVGQTACRLAEMAGIEVPYDTKVLIHETDDTSHDCPWANEKLTTLLGMYKAETLDEAFDICYKLVLEGGAGHSAALYIDPTEEEKITRFGLRMKAGRILINQPTSFGGIGDLYNFGLAPSLTLGPGSVGHSAFMGNTHYEQLLDIKTVTLRKENMLWLQLPKKVYYKTGCTPVALREMKEVYNFKRAFIITDSTLYQLGACDAIINQLRDKVGVMYGNPEVTTGGRALKFYASVRIDVRRIEALKNGGEVVGNRTRAKVVKNKVAPPFREAEFDIMYGEGIAHTGELIDLGVRLGIITKAGSWFSMGEVRIGQGRDAAKKYLEENPDIAADVEAQIRANFDKLMGNQSRIAAAKAAGKAVNVSADDFNDED